MATKSSKSVELSSKKEPKKTPASKSVAKVAVTIAKQAVVKQKPEKSKATKSINSTEAASTPRKKTVTKTTSSKISSSIALNPKPPVKEPRISQEEISLRAYFIAERRQKMGWPGDAATDWADAVSQLRAETLEKPLKKR